LDDENTALEGCFYQMTSHLYKAMLRYKIFFFYEQSDEIEVSDFFTEDLKIQKTICA